MTPQAIVIPIPAGQAVDVFPAAETPEKRWFRNRGPGEATFATGATATAASSALEAGEKRAPRYRTRLKLSVYSAAGTTIVGEKWS